jgi:Cu(I)-responsive transcriptional regulator
MGYPMNIGEAAQAAGVTAKMIRHYEEMGLIREASRTEAGYRQYTERDVNVLRFIRQSRAIGFSIKQIEQLLGLWADTRRESREVKTLASQHAAELDRKIAEMSQMKAALEQIAADCHGDQTTDCPILRKLAADAATVPAPPASKRAAKRHHGTNTRPGTGKEPAPHVGLLAWMQGLSPSGMADPA